jgi:hypothetical protein
VLSKGLVRIKMGHGHGIREHRHSSTMGTAAPSRCFASHKPPQMLSFASHKPPQMLSFAVQNGNSHKGGSKQQVEISRSKSQTRQQTSFLCRWGVLSGIVSRW